MKKYLPVITTVFLLASCGSLTNVRSGAHRPKEKFKTKAPSLENSFLGSLRAWSEKILRQNPKQVTIRDKKFPIDCSNFVRAVYFGANGRDLFEEATKAGITQKLARESAVFGDQLGVLMIYVLFKHQHRISQSPAPGDIIFFDNTYDRNKNRKRDDFFSHTGLVLEVASDGTVTFIHAGTSKGVQIGFLNLHYPHLHKKDGKIINSYLRHTYAWDNTNQRLTGQLVRGFGRL